MKNAILFKTLVDILYMIHVIGLIGVIIFIPLGGNLSLNEVEVTRNDWDLFFWLIALVSIAKYLIFLRGLYYLRRMARFLLSNKFISEKIIKNLKKSGIHFLVTGIIAFVLYVALWLKQLSGGKIEFTYDSNLFIPLFLAIIGLFFIIQSNTLVLAKKYKEENELTV